VSILGSVLNTAVPAGRRPAAFVILGIATIAGVSLGVGALRAAPAGHLRARSARKVRTSGNCVAFRADIVII
jgi:hypothetical protein